VREERSRGGVSNVDIDGNNIIEIKAIGVAISTFETLPKPAPLVGMPMNDESMEMLGIIDELR
jgi:hypothetical protein